MVVLLLIRSVLSYLIRADKYQSCHFRLVDISTSSRKLPAGLFGSNGLWHSLLIP